MEFNEETCFLLCNEMFYLKVWGSRGLKLKWPFPILMCRRVVEVSGGDAVRERRRQSRLHINCLCLTNSLSHGSVRVVKKMLAVPQKNDLCQR